MLCPADEVELAVAVEGVVSFAVNGRDYDVPGTVKKEHGAGEPGGLLLDGKGLGRKDVLPADMEAVHVDAFRRVLGIAAGGEEPALQGEIFNDRGGSHKDKAIRGRTGFFQPAGEHTGHYSALRMAQQDDTVHKGQFPGIVIHNLSVLDHFGNRIAFLRSFTMAVAVKIETENGITMMGEQLAQKAHRRSGHGAQEAVHQDDKIALACLFVETGRQQELGGQVSDGALELECVIQCLIHPCKDRNILEYSGKRSPAAGFRFFH